MTRIRSCYPPPSLPKTLHTLSRLFVPSEFFSTPHIDESSSDEDEDSSVSTPRLDPTSDGWLSVLSLATQWHFDDLRKKAIEVLSNQSHTALDKVILGRTFVVSNWLVSAYQDLVTSDKPLTPESEHTLGEWAVSHLREIKMERRQAERAGEKFDVCKKVKEAFEDELMDDEEYREAVKLEQRSVLRLRRWSL